MFCKNIVFEFDGKLTQSVAQKTMSKDLRPLAFESSFRVIS